MDADEFERITSTLINRLRDEEMRLTAMAQDSGADGVVEAVLSRDDLITWYIENNAEPGAVVDDEYERISKVIRRMVNHDMSLIVS